MSMQQVPSQTVAVLPVAASGATQSFTTMGSRVPLRVMVIFAWSDVVLGKLLSNAAASVP